MKRPIFCPYCKSKNIVKNGFYKYKDIEKEQRYLCKNCNKLFLEKTSSPFHQMRNPADVVLFGVRLYTEFFLTSEECARLIQDIKNIKVTGRSVLYWVQKLTPYFQKISRMYKP